MQFITHQIKVKTIHIPFLIIWQLETTVHKLLITPDEPIEH